MNVKDIINKIKNSKQMKQMNKYVTEEKIWVFFIYLIITWWILYLIPEIFLSLFGTLLGNLILIIATLLAFAKSRVFGFLIGSSFLIMYRFYYLAKTKKETFQETILVDGTENQFLLLQSTLNRDTNYDISKLKQDISKQEMNYFFKNGMWPWSQETIDLYTQAINKNSYIRNHFSESIKEARSKYHEHAILKILSLQTKEGIFLVDGVSVPAYSLPSGYGSFGYKSGLIVPTDDVIKCNIDSFGKNSTLEKLHYTGKLDKYNEESTVTLPVDYHDLEKEIPGFTFVNKPCNPCKAYDFPSNYSCPFQLDLKEDKGISSIWKYLWSKK
jgi:hypothetical protein